MKLSLWFTFAALVSPPATPVFAGPETAAVASPRTVAVKESVDWENFFRPLDMVWTKLPDKWSNAPILGNGMAGVTVRKTGDNALSWEVGRADIEDHRRPGDPKSNGLYDRPRFAPGAFVLKTAGKITGCDLRLSLWNAELAGTVTTSAGKIAVRSFVPARGPMVVVAEIVPDAGEAGASWKWEAFPAISPRFLKRGAWSGQGKREAPDYRGNPPPAVSGTDDDGICIQKLDNGATATAWRIVKTGTTRTLIAGLAHTYPENNAGDVATASVKSAGASGVGALRSAHRAWWHAWYPGSFVSLPDNYWTAFYWTQLYKMASATRPDGVILDLQGPWAQRETAWPGNWTNLNLQLTYWPAYVGNRLDLADSLRANVTKYRDNLIANVPEKYRSDSAGIGRASALDLFRPVMEPGRDKEAEIGSLLWICHNLWWQYRVTMDDQMLREDVYPILRRAVNYHLHFAYDGKDGRIHLPATFSPEYGAAPDCNYDLALLKWGCRTLLWIDGRLKLNDPLAAKWKDVDARIVDFPQDKNGFMIGAGKPFAMSHRHYSHLFMIWPLRLLDADKPETKEIAERSVRWWHSKKGGLQGYSYTGGASLLATIGDSEGAYGMLNGVKRFIKPNTLYDEGGNPVIETPLSANQSIHDMLLQSVGDEIRVFSAIPKEWGDVVFRDLRGEGAFLVSAERKTGATRWIVVKSLAGEPLKLRGKFAVAPAITGVPEDRVKTVPGGWDIVLKKDESVVLAEPGVVPEVKPVALSGAPNPFGMK